MNGIRGLLAFWMAPHEAASEFSRATIQSDWENVLRRQKGRDLIFAILI